MSKIPKSHNSKDSVTFVMTSCEVKCVTLETSVSKKWGESLQPSTQEYSKMTTPKTSISNTCVAACKGRGYNFYFLVPCGGRLFNSHVTYDVTSCIYDVTSSA